MKKYVLIGTGDFANIISNTIEDAGDEVIGYVVDKKYLIENEYMGKPVTAFETITEDYSTDEYIPVVAFMGSKMNSQRYEKFCMLKDMGYKMDNVIHPTASISKRSVIGEGNVFLQFTIVAPGAVIGDCNFFSPKSYICHDVVVGSANHFSPGVSTTGFSQIGNNCILGVNCAINNKVKVADYTFIGGGMFITGDTKQYDVYVPERSKPLERIRSIDFQIFTARRR